MKISQGTANFINMIIMFLSLFAASLAASDVITGKAAIVSIAFTKCAASAFQWYLTNNAYTTLPNGEKMPESASQLPPGTTIAENPPTKVVQQ